MHLKNQLKVEFEVVSKTLMSFIPREFEGMLYLP